MFEASLEMDAKSRAIIDQFEDLIDEETISDAALDGANIVLDEAIRLAPLGPTGNLKRGLVAKKFQRKGESQAFVAVDYRIAPHAHLVEYGTVKTRPHPFLRPAADTKQEEVARAVEKRIIAGIEKKLGEHVG